MKRTRLNTITDLTKNDKVKAIKRVNSLIDDGLTLNKARNAVASELGVTPSGVAYWQRTIKVKQPTRATKTTTVTTKNGSNVIQGIESMKGSLGIVFNSLVVQDGRYTNQDAGAISGIANNILGCCKQVLLERKHADKVHKTQNLAK